MKDGWGGEGGISSSIIYLTLPRDEDELSEEDRDLDAFSNKTYKI